MSLVTEMMVTAGGNQILEKIIPFSGSSAEVVFGKVIAMASKNMSMGHTGRYMMCISDVCHTCGIVDEKCTEETKVIKVATFFIPNERERHVDKVEHYEYL